MVSKRNALTHVNEEINVNVDQNFLFQPVSED